MFATLRDAKRPVHITSSTEVIFITVIFGFNDFLLAIKVNRRFIIPSAKPIKLLFSRCAQLSTQKRKLCE